MAEEPDPRHIKGRNAARQRSPSHLRGGSGVLGGSGSRGRSRGRYESEAGEGEASQMRQLQPIGCTLVRPAFISTTVAPPSNEVNRSGVREFPSLPLVLIRCVIGRCACGARWSRGLRPPDRHGQGERRMCGGHDGHPGSSALVYSGFCRACPKRLSSFRSRRGLIRPTDRPASR
jgi:hypothetical protein